MTDRSLHLEFHWAETKTKANGSVELTISGTTVNGQTHKIVLRMGPSSIGYIAQDLHQAVAALQSDLDTVKRQLRGEG